MEKVMKKGEYYKFKSFTSSLSENIIVKLLEDVTSQSKKTKINIVNHFDNDRLGETAWVMYEGHWEKVKAYNTPLWRCLNE
jgi:hypothetical protein